MKKFLTAVLSVGLVLALVIFGIRAYNGNKYDKFREVRDTGKNPIYSEPGVNYSDPIKSKIPGVTVTEVKGDYMDGYHWLPKEIRKRGSIVIFGGSEGNVDPYKAAFLAKEGYNVYSMYFFGGKGQPEELENIPLEFFREILGEIEKSGNPDDPLTVIGTSKGAELALVLGTIYPEIDNLVLYAPSSHVFQGLSSDSQGVHSSWKYEGRELPFLNFRDGDLGALMEIFRDMIFNIPITYLPTYEVLLDQAPNTEDARIPVENFQGNLLLFAGTDDKVWPSARMGKLIKEHKRDCELHIFQDAGHLFYGPPVLEVMNMGGTYDANEKAGTESAAILKDFLAAHSEKL